MGSLWRKYIMLELKKYTGVIFKTLKSDAKFEEKLTCSLKNHMRNLTNFHQSTWKCQNSDFDGQKMYDLKIYRGVMYQDNEE